MIPVTPEVSRRAPRIFEAESAIQTKSQWCRNGGSRAVSVMTDDLQLPSPQSDVSEHGSRFSVFAVRPVISDEDPAAYDAFFDRVAATIKPQDFIEQIFLHD